MHRLLHFSKLRWIQQHEMGIVGSYLKERPHEPLKILLKVNKCIKIQQQDKLQLRSINIYLYFQTKN
jgi:hypothetical protein